MKRTHLYVLIVAVCLVVAVAIGIHLLHRVALADVQFVVDLSDAGNPVQGAELVVSWWIGGAPMGSEEMTESDPGRYKAYIQGLSPSQFDEWQMDIITAGIDPVVPPNDPATGLSPNNLYLDWQVEDNR